MAAQKNIGRQVSGAKAALAGKANPGATAKPSAPVNNPPGGWTAIRKSQSHGSSAVKGAK